MMGDCARFRGGSYKQRVDFEIEDTSDRRGKQEVTVKTRAERHQLRFTFVGGRTARWQRQGGRRGEEEEEED